MHYVGVGKGALRAVPTINIPRAEVGWARGACHRARVRATRWLWPALRSQRLEPRQEPLLGLGRAPGRQVILPGRRGQTGITPEETLCFGLRKTCKLCRLQISRGPIGILDLPIDLVRKHRRQSEADMNRRQQPLLSALLVSTKHRLERRDHVAAAPF